MLYGIGLAIELDNVDLDVNLVNLDIKVMVVVKINVELVVGVVEVSESKIVLSSS